MRIGGFSILDIIRILGGILVFNALFSWWFTGSSTWGYDGKYVDPRYMHFMIFGKYTQFSASDLAEYNGTNPSKPIYIGINGSVYDVTAAKSFYGPLGRYAMFAGKDCARAWATGCLGNPEVLTPDLRGLGDEELNELAKWEFFFKRHKRYWLVGKVISDELTGDPPGPCKGFQFPGH